MCKKQNKIALNRKMLILQIKPLTGERDKKKNLSVFFVFKNVVVIIGGK